MSSRSNLPFGKTDTRQKGQSGLLKAPLPQLDDPEGDYLSASLPFTVDAHVHLFPDHLFSDSSLCLGPRNPTPHRAKATG